ncbi:MAG TPA: NADH-quinone oxidoreductase subunit N [Myxococcales bacterium]|nr:NADH-quinone oxidoreductase subunit N [Myxococcales bacterium]
MHVDPHDIAALLPEILLSCGALILMLSEVFLRGERRGYQAVVAAAFAAAAFAAFVEQVGAPARAVFGGFAVVDAFATFLGAVICVGLFVTTLLGAGFLRPRAAERGEFYALALLAAAGMCLLVRGADLLLLFVALEIMSVSTYALAAYLRVGTRPAESAFKYFILGAFSSALFLYGAALCYGAAGGTSLASLRAAPSSPLLLAGLALLVSGLAFKLAVVPFHMWTPDVYEGAPTPVTSFLSVGVKTAALAALARILVTAFGANGEPASWLPLVEGLAVLTMVVGNLLALSQRNVKRMLAYSSVAHAGYLLVAIAAASNPAARGDAVTGLLFYLAAYTATTAGAFAALAALERLSPDDPAPWDIERFAGLARRRPWAAAATALLMLSLAGIPPSAGFVGKLLVFRAAVNAGLVPLAIVGVLASVVGLYYYLRVVVAMYMQPAPTAQIRGAGGWPLDLALAATSVAVLLVGLGPGPLVAAATASATLFGG